MAKLVSKSDLEFDQGYVTYDGDVVSIGLALTRQLNELETKVQEARYLHRQPDAQPVPSMDGFERQSTINAICMDSPDTPELDASVERAMRIAKEIDAIDTSKKLNKVFSEYDKVAEFLATDKVLVDDAIIERIDTPVLGNPLELTGEKLLKILVEA